MSHQISKYDRHPLDPYVRFLSNPFAVVLFSSLALCLGVILSIMSGDWLWLSRFGSLIAVAGLLLTMSPIFERGIYVSHSNAGKLVAIDEHRRPILTSEEDRALGRKVLAGIFVSIIGTVIWGFGDLVGTWL